MSLTLLNVSGARPIAKIKGDGKLNNQILYVLPYEDNEMGMVNMELDPKMKFHPIPDNTKNRDCHYITGASGSGKSTWCRKFINEFQQQHKKKKKDIYLFSRITEDESLDSIKPLRIKIGDNLVVDPLQLEDFKDSLVIFDDTDIIKPKKLRDEVDHLRDEILQGGRHKNITCLITNHNMVGKDLKTVLNECHTITFFPANYNRQLKYLLNEYLGLDKNQIKKIRQTKSRWVTVFKSFPQVILTENEVYLAKNTIDD
jgi:nicotinamide riboside kinase